MLIKKRSDYKEHTCLLGLGKSKDADFNKGKSIEVSDDEFNKLSNFGWIEVVLKKVKKDKVE